MCRKLLAAFLLIIFGLILPLTIIVFNVKAVFLNAEKLKEIFHESNLYREAANFINFTFREALEQELSEEGLKLGSPGIPKEFLEAEFISTAWFEKAGDRIIDGLVGFLNGEIDEPAVMVPMGELAEESVFFMKPEGMGGEEVPEQLNILELLGGAGPQKEGAKSLLETLVDLRDIIQKVTLGLYIAVAVLFVLFILIVLLIRRPLRSLFRWMGFTLLLPGLFLMIASLIAKFLIVQGKMRNIFLQQAEGTPPLSEEAARFLTSIQAVFFDLTNAVVVRNLIWSGVFFVIGLILIIISFFFKKQLQEQVVTNKPEEEIPEPAPAAPQATIIKKDAAK